MMTNLNKLSAVHESICVFIWTIFNFITWKQALGQGLRGSVEPILLTTLRVDPCGLFCQIGITPEEQENKNKYKIYTNIDKTWLKWLFRCLSTYSFRFHFAESEERKHWRLGLYSSVLIIIIIGHWTCSFGMRVPLPWNTKKKKNIKYSLSCAKPPWMLVKKSCTV